jgi:hypothetical protein
MLGLFRTLVTTERSPFSLVCAKELRALLARPEVDLTELANACFVIRFAPFVCYDLRRVQPSEVAFHRAILIAVGIRCLVRLPTVFADELMS